MWVLLDKSASKAEETYRTFSSNFAIKMMFFGCGPLPVTPQLL
jgi:hypothetical protein